MGLTREAQLQRQIERIKQKLVALGDLRPGSISRQFNVCGNPGCQCKATPPVRHGPYHQLSYSRKGKGSTRFVREQELPIVRQQLKNFKSMRLLG
jgi:hypothetical protein